MTTPMLRNNTEALSGVKSFEDALALLAEAGIAPVSSDDYGDGFALLKDKNLLLNREFLIMEFRIVPSDKFEGEFVVVHLVTDKGEKYIMTDGSTGIKDQLVEIARRGRTNGIHCKSGLTKSDYTHTNETTGEQTAATTYYIA